VGGDKLRERKKNTLIPRKVRKIVLIFDSKHEAKKEDLMRRSLGLYAIPGEGESMSTLERSI